MSSTTSKRQDFVSEPMRDKLVTALPGIGEALGGRLEEQGIRKAYVLLGKFLCYKKDEARFSEWLKDKTQANVHQADLCTRCLKEWCNAFL